MKKTKFFVIASTLAISFSTLVGCGNVVATDSNTKQYVDETKGNDHAFVEAQGKTDNQDLKEPTVEFEVESEEEVGKNAKEVAKKENIEEPIVEKELEEKEINDIFSVDLVQTFKDKEWISFEHMEFFVNGKTYELGKTTLRELIDDGVVFDDLTYAENKIKANCESEEFLIKLNSKEDWNVAISVGNFSDEVKTIADCPVCKICFSTNSKLEMDANEVSFSFPLNPTIDDLKMQAGEPTFEEEYAPDDSENANSFCLEYKKDASIYLGSYGYTFNYCENELKSIKINYMP